MQIQLDTFRGILTRKRFGKMNSGMTRWGKARSLAPFDKTGSITFSEVPTNIDPTHTTFTDLVVDSILNEEGGILYMYSVDRSGTVYKTNTTTDATTIIASGLIEPYFNKPVTLKFGGGLRLVSYFGVPKLFVSHDNGMLYMNIDGTSILNVGNFISMGFGTTQVTIGNPTMSFTSASPASAVGISSGLALFTGMAVTWSGNAPPAPFVNNVTYYLIIKSIGGNGSTGTFQLASTIADAMAGNAITPTTSPASSNYILSGSGWVQDSPHPIEEFFGGIFVGNGFSLFDFGIDTLTVSVANRLSPSIPRSYSITTLEADGQGRYLRIGISNSVYQDLETIDPSYIAQATQSRSIYWNGVDQGYDSYDPLQQTNVTSMFSFLGLDISMGADFYGSAMLQSSGGTVEKVGATKEIRPPLPGALTSTGNLLLFGAPYFVQNAWRAGIFGFGKLDDEDDSNAFYPLLAIAPGDSNTVCTDVGVVRVVQNRIIKSDGTTLFNSKMYVSTYETGATARANMYSFNLTPGSGVPTDGVYETQIEKFPLPQSIQRIVLNITPSTAGVSFQVDVIDVDGTIPVNGTFTYTYAAGTDETLLQGPIEKVVWENPQIKNMQAMGVRFTNLGTMQPGINSGLIETSDTDKAVIQQQS